MGFWLAAFIVLFAAVELFNWVVHIGSWHTNGVWLVLGGMGLAAISNWSVGKEGTKEVAAKETVSKLNQPEGEHLESVRTKATAHAVDRLDDSISFKVRPLKR